jgi:hypothetical protein
MPKFVVNGQEYASIEAMPPEARAAYQQMQGLFADQNNNGVPDLFEGAGVNMQTMTIDSSTASGRTLSPEEARRVAEQVMGAFGGQPGSDVFGSAVFGREQPPGDDWFRSGPAVPSAPQWDAPRPKARLGIKKLMILLVLLDVLVLAGFLAWQFWPK